MEEQKKKRIKNLKICGYFFITLGIVNFIFRIVKSDYNLFAIIIGVLFIIIGAVFIKWAPILVNYLRER